MITITIMAFLVDVVTGNLVHGVADTWEAAYWMANAFCANRALFEAILVILFIPLHTWFILKYRPRFDVWDLCAYALWSLSMLLTVYDYHTNDNLREVDIDISAFGITMGVIVILKIITVQNLWNRISFKTRR